MDTGYILMRVDSFIWEDQELNYPEKIILNFIFSWSIQEKCCFASSEWIASKFGWDERFVDQVISMLQARGYVSIIEKDWQYPRRLSVILPGHSNPCVNFEDITAIDV
jgi:hypothetical protein